MLITIRTLTRPLSPLFTITPVLLDSYRFDIPSLLLVLHMPCLIQFKQGVISDHNKLVITIIAKAIDGYLKD